MLQFGVLLVIYALVSNVLVNLIMLGKFLSRAPQSGPAIGEIISFLFGSELTKSYRELLIKDGVEPTIFDELLYRINTLLNFALLAGIVIIALGLIVGD